MLCRQSKTLPVGVQGQWPRCTSGAIGKHLAQSQMSRSSTFEQLALRAISFCAVATPLSTRIQRWPEVIPHFDVGHLARLRAVLTRHREQHGSPGIYGDYISAPYIEAHVYRWGCSR